MGITRRSRFGFPPPTPPSSQYTVRLVPLTQGVRQDQPWPLLPPGSTVSMTNFLPLDGAITPRSRLSSLNTLRTINPSIVGMAEVLTDGSSAPDWWVSGATQHGILASNGSISLASFISANGYGTAPATSVVDIQYTHAFGSAINDNMLIAATVRAGPSHDTLLCLYDSSGPKFSYVTGAPHPKAVGSFDNYIIAWNLQGSSVGGTTVKWCVRGEPFNWTGEGSGFEDLLDMRGMGTAVRGMPDGRVILFGTVEIWYGVRATYPAQFTFTPLEKHVGCPFQRTIQETDAGLLFLGSDLQLRLLPLGGGVSQAVSASIAPTLRRQDLQATIDIPWGVYDPYTKMYYLFVDRSNDGSTPFVGLAINVNTGEWAYIDMGARNPVCGMSHVQHLQQGSTWISEGVLFASDYTVHSLNSLLATDSGSTMTATFRSAPIAADLPGNYKQLTNVFLDYRSTSSSTVTLRVSTDGGNTYETTGRVVTLPRAPAAGRAESQVYLGGSLPAIELTSTSTGFELHRVDVAMHLGGRRA